MSSGNGEGGLLGGLDLDKLLQDAQVAAKKVEARENTAKAKAEKKKKAKRRATAARLKRQRGQDTPLTEKLVYRVLDKTGKKVYIVVGLGRTEILVDELQSHGHTLAKFKMTKTGQSMGTPRPYQCILDGRGKGGNFRWFWKPTESYEVLEVIDPTNAYAVFTVESWPYYPGGLTFALQKVTPVNEKFAHQDEVRMSPDYAAEVDHLTALKKAGTPVISQFTKPDEIIRAMAILAGTHPTEQAIKEATAQVMQHVTCWPPSPAEMEVIGYASWLPPQE